MANPLPNPTPDARREYGWLRSPLRTGKGRALTPKATALLAKADKLNLTRAKVLDGLEPKL